ncbi:hypothetical protein CALCODRAFT_517522 [Calocera cornea HHB12733]|uniref:DUF6533 domain-containing protein n=1 Tax=Calocera cornea HHB12733 TaxID=1353952 RepID=A0A165FWQ5_9BASI|nr:hypothetical protein CALCODRAFT_517522 [Calocera cornea HHB12733]
MSVLPQSEAVQVAWQVHNFSACTSASVTLVCFDYLVTLPQEIALIWLTKWTPGKALFIVVRYVGLLAATTYAYGFGIINAVLASMQSPQSNCSYILYAAFMSIAPCRIILNLRGTSTELDRWDVTTVQGPALGGRERRRTETSGWGESAEGLGDSED